MAKQFISLLAILLLYISCKKNPVNIKNENHETYQLISTGSILNPYTGKFEPYYWKNEKIFPLPFTGGISTYAHGVEVVDNNIYIAGSFDTPNEAHEALPCYWKNGRQINLPIKDIPGSFSVCAARDIKIVNNKIYILGAVDLNPVIWIIEGNNTETIIIEAEQETLYGGYRVTSNLQLHNNKLYLGGDQVSLSTANKPAFQVGYWTFDIASKIVEWHQFEKNLTHATAFAISASEKGIFISGEAQTDISGSPRIALWKNGRRLPLNVDNFDKLRMNEVHMNDDGKLYANVLDYASNKPLIWKIDGSDNIETARPLIPGDENGHCISLAVIKNNQAYIGYYVKKNLYYLWGNINGKDVDFELPYRMNIVPAVSEWVKFE